MKLIIHDLSCKHCDGRGAKVMVQRLHQAKRFPVTRHIEMRDLTQRMNAGVANGMAAAGHQVVDAQEPIEMVRAIKSSGEVACISASLALTERAVSALRDAIRPGQTENELWAVLHHEVIAGNGDYCETRLLNAGPRSNPWFQESSHRVIEPNELIALDTDVVGCHGYYADFSCTFHAGPDAPSVEQRRLYALAHGSCTTTSPSSSRG